jgi:dephospho-CoA kinase
MVRIGLTGGIGSGKSTIARMFEVLGIPVYYADAAAKQLMESNALLKSQIINIFGEESYMELGLNRSYIASKTFGSSLDAMHLTSELNAAVHPAVEADFEDWVGKQASLVPYVLKEAALMYEAGTYKKVHAVLNIAAPEALRIARILNRDPQRSKAQITAIISRQLSEGERESRAEYTLINDGVVPVMKIILELDTTFRAMQFNTSYLPRA